MDRPGRRFQYGLRTDVAVHFVSKNVINVLGSAMWSSAASWRRAVYLARFDWWWWESRSRTHRGWPIGRVVVLINKIMVSTTPAWICRFFMAIISMFGFVFVFAFFCTDDVFSFCRFLQLFCNCYTVLMFALLVANWPFCIKKCDLIWFDLSMHLLGRDVIWFESNV